MKRWNLSTRLAIVGWLFLPMFFSMYFVAYRMVSRSRLETWAEYAGKLQAKVWYQENHCRLLELSSNGKTEYTGRKDGQLEIWTWSYYTNSTWLVTGDPDRVFVEAFNQRMKELCSEKSKDQK